MGRVCAAWQGGGQCNTCSCTGFICRLRRSVLDGVQLILKVLVDLLKGCELALEDTHLAEDVFERRWLLGHGFSLHSTILGSLTACHGRNLDKFLRKFQGLEVMQQIVRGDALGDQIQGMLA